VEEKITNESKDAVENKPESVNIDSKEPAESSSELEKAEEIKTPEDKPVEPEKKEEKEEEEVPYIVSDKKKKSDSEIEYLVQITLEEFLKKEDKIYKFIRTNTIIEGFRKGKAPLNLMKLRFEKEVHKQIVDEVSENIAKQIIKKDELKEVANPRVVDWKLSEEEKEGKKIISALNITIAFEIEPEIVIEPELLNNVNVKIHKIEIDDELVNKEIENIRFSNATYEAKSDDSVFEQGDAITIDIEVRDENDKIIPQVSRSNIFLKSPKDELPTQIFEALSGVKKGDKIEKEIPNNRFNKIGEIYSKVDKYIVNILEIKKIILPELDDEFAKDLGSYENLQQLRDGIRNNLEKDKSALEREMIVTGIEKYLLEKIRVEPPSSVVQSEFVQSYNRKVDSLKYYNLSKDYIKKSKERFTLDSFIEAKIGIIIDLIYMAIAKSEKINVTEEDVDKEIEILAEKQGRKPLAIRGHLEANKKLDLLRGAILKKKTADFLISKANINYVSNEEYEKEREEYDKLIVDIVVKPEKEDKKEEVTESSEKEAAAEKEAVAEEKESKTL